MGHLPTGRPLRAVLELTYRCNLRCVHCYCVHDMRGVELSTVEWLHVLDQLAELGVLVVTLTGGEILLRADLFEIAAAARERRFALRYFTNAALIDDQRAEAFAATQPLSVDVSLYGADAPAYRAVTGSGAAFERTLDGIARLRARGLKVKVKLPLLKENWQGVLEMHRLCLELGAEPNFDHQVFPRDDGDRAPLRHALEDQELKALVKLDPRWRENFVERRSAPAEAPVCDLGRKAITITPFGEVLPCARYKHESLGNVRLRPLREIWSNEALAPFQALARGDLAACRICKFQGFCRVCPATAARFGGLPTGPDPNACQRARVYEALGLLRSAGQKDPSDGSSNRQPEMAAASVSRRASSAVSPVTLPT